LTSAKAVQDSREKRRSRNNPADTARHVIMTTPCATEMQSQSATPVVSRLVALSAERYEVESRLEKVTRALQSFSPETQALEARLPRGDLRKAILRLLKRAPSSGVSVKAIASALKRDPAAIHVWFYTTGRALPQIKKVGRGVYVWSESSN
jgi:hypothetical protein